MLVLRRLTPLLAVALLALSAAPAQAITFGPDLATAIADYPYGCNLVGAWQGCTLQDPLAHDMELVLPDPVVNGNQTGVVTAIHVKAAAPAPAQFVVVEWSGKPGEGNPFPSGVMAVSAPVALQPGMNHFTTNLPVDRRLAANGFESWSVVSLTILNGTSPIPAQSGGAFAETGVLVDNGRPLTQTTADLTAVPHNVQVGGLPPAKLLMAGELTITTGNGTDPPNTPADPGDATPRASELKLPAAAKLKGRKVTVPLTCAGAADCAGTLRIQSRPAPGAAAARTPRRPKTVTYASSTFSIGAGLTGSVKATLSKDGRRALKRHRSVRAYANVTFADGRVMSARITLRR
jgi:hypothetical protein